MRLFADFRTTLILRKPAALVALIGCSGTLFMGAPVIAQTSDSAEDLKAQIAQMRQQMQQQMQSMQQMQQRLDELEKKQTAQAQASAAQPADASGSLATSARLAESVQAAPPRPPSAPAGVAEPLPGGYVRLGDTGSLLKLDLVSQLDTMVDDTFMAQDLFLPSSIPVKGQPFYGSGWRSTLSGKQSIFRMDFRRDTPFGLLKVVYKNNFFGSGSGDMPYNLLYFYGELEAEHYSLLAGYNLSAFTDISAFPNTLDYEGPNSFTFKYAPQIGVSPILLKAGDGKLTLPISLEKPNADITVPEGFAAFSRRPDATIGLRWETPAWHIQWANLIRDLGVQNATTGQSRTTSAFATQLTAASSLFERDSVQGWASYGKGYANFLQDISGLGLDAAFNPDIELKAIKARGYGVGYTHGWTKDLSSSASYGYLRISPDSDLILAQTLPKSTKFASVNLAWQFSERAMLGMEYLWGENIDLADERGTGQRVQATIRYDLNP
jgi:hypothetical protein